MENALTKNNNQVDAVVVSNDGTAGGAIQALAEQKLAGKVLVSGQDADMAACQRIVAGTQSMTVYKPIKKLADKAAEIAVAMAKKQPITDKTTLIHNGKKDVPSILLEPVAGGQGQPGLPPSSPTATRKRRRCIKKIQLTTGTRRTRLK